ncbi:MAG: S8 family serine peptidase [Actinomycetota bacterium]|nr:S8 family serine peptidase [Actinomycetota bacterium]
MGTGADERLVVEPMPGQFDAAVGAVNDAGGSIVRIVAGVFDVLVDRESAEAIAASPAVRAVNGLAPAFETQVDASLISEGVAAADATGWRSVGWTGAGTTIAVVDSGFGGWAAGVAAGEVPAVPADRRVNHCDAGFEGTRHGTVTSELIHDTAPGADLVLVCIDDHLDLATAVDDLVARDIDIVNMSLGFYNTSRGDGSGGPGTPEHSVRRVMQSGVLWVNSAGNDARTHWGGAFTDADGNGRHEWAAGDEAMAFTLPASGRVVLFLRWDQWPVADVDLDICLTEDPAIPPMCIERRQAPGADPVDQVILDNPYDRPVTLHALVEAVGGPIASAPRVDLFTLGAVDLEHPVAATSLAEPLGAPGIIGVGAYCVHDGQLVPYSSQGPTIDGRVGVSIVASESVSTTTLGQASGCGVGYRGTSASAPYVAGALALLSEAIPEAGPNGVLAELQARAAAAGDPGAPGLDPVYGHGYLNLGTAPPRGDQAGDTEADPVLAVSDHPDRSEPRPLSGQTLSGETYVFVRPEAVSGNIAMVRFFVDGMLVQVEKQAGYDLGGGMPDRAYPIDLARFGPGEHTVMAETTLTDGTVSQAEATFTVDAATPAIPRPFEVVVSADPASEPVPMNGTVLSGGVYVSLRPVDPLPAAVDHVLFYIDAEQVGYDGAAPYEMLPASNGVVPPFDTATLANGQHMLQAIAFLVDGSIVTANASYTVEN